MPNKFSQPAFYLERPSIRFLIHFCSTGPPQVNAIHVSNPNAHYFFHQPAFHLDRYTIRFLTHFCSAGHVCNDIAFDCPNILTNFPSNRLPYSWLKAILEREVFYRFIDDTRQINRYRLRILKTPSFVSVHLA